MPVEPLFPNSGTLTWRLGSETDGAVRGCGQRQHCRRTLSLGLKDADIEARRHGCKHGQEHKYTLEDRQTLFIETYLNT